MYAIKYVYGKHFIKLLRTW